MNETTATPTVLDEGVISATQQLAFRTMMARSRVLSLSEHIAKQASALGKALDSSSLQSDFFLPVLGAQSLADLNEARTEFLANLTALRVVVTELGMDVTDVFLMVTDPIGYFKKLREDQNK